MKKHGHLTVHSRGETEILLSFKPHRATAEFEEDEECSIVPACEVCRPDEVTVDIRHYEDMHQYALFIKWHVSKPRRIKWKVSRGFF